MKLSGRKMFERFFDSLRDQGTRIGLKVKELYWIYHTVILLSISKYTRAKKKKKKRKKERRRDAQYFWSRFNLLLLYYIFL